MPACIQSKLGVLVLSFLRYANFSSYLQTYCRATLGTEDDLILPYIYPSRQLISMIAISSSILIVYSFTVEDYHGEQVISWPSHAKLAVLRRWRNRGQSMALGEESPLKVFNERNQVPQGYWKIPERQNKYISLSKRIANVKFMIFDGSALTQYKKELETLIECSYA